MPNVGFGEIFMLVLILLIVVGPSKLPEIMRNLGKAYRTFSTEMQKAQDSLRVSIDEPVAPPKPGAGVIDVPDEHVPPPPPQEPFQPPSAPEAEGPPSEAPHAQDRPPADEPSPAMRRYEDT